MIKITAKESHQVETKVREVLFARGGPEYMHLLSGEARDARMRHKAMLNRVREKTVTDGNKNLKILNCVFVDHAPSTRDTLRPHDSQVSSRAMSHAVDRTIHLAVASSRGCTSSRLRTHHHARMSIERQHRDDLGLRQRRRRMHTCMHAFDCEYWCTQT